MAREDCAISVDPSISAEIPTPLPPPVTVTDVPLLAFIKASASFCDNGKQVSEPLILWANIAVDVIAAMTMVKIIDLMIFNY
jgi:hypothetical protein